MRGIQNRSAVGVELSRTRKKLVATANRREGVYNRTGEPSVTFCEKEEQGSGRMAYFLSQTKNKPEQSELCSGLVRPEGLEPPTFWFVAKHSIQLSYERTFVKAS